MWDERKGGREEKSGGGREGERRGKREGGRKGCAVPEENSLFGIYPWVSDTVRVSDNIVFSDTRCNFV